MRIVAIIFNLSLLAILIVAIAHEGLPDPAEDTFIFFWILLSVGTSFVNLWYLFMGNAATWLSLVFQRKAAEERRRLAELQPDKESKQGTRNN